MAQYHCCVPHCNNDGRKKSHKDLRFFNFPTEKKLRQAWIIAIRRDESPLFKIQKDSTLVCSEHVKPDEIEKTLAGKKRLKKQVVPSIFAWVKPKQERSENLYQRRKRLRCDTPSPLSKDVEVSDDMAGSASLLPSLVEPSKEGALCNRIAELEEIIAVTSEKITVMSLDKFGLERFSNNPKQIQFYTGFSSYELLKSVFIWLEPSAKNMSTWSQVQRSGTPPVDFQGKTGDSMRVKQGFPIEDLAVRFKVSPSTVRRVFLTWANFLYFMLGQIPIWPTKVQSYTTYKGLVGISPNGSVTFVSSLFQGSVSDKEITRQSGILNLLEEGAVVMADKGFLIEDLLKKVNATLMIPPFLGKSKGCNVSGGKQFTAAEVSNTQEIARLRIHVARAIRRVKEYHFFDRVQPLVLGGSINQVWSVCCFLTNLKGLLF
ncbi:uncharacterized protein [Montipora capricornis]|uniref:uncharacterized protein n=1 Tax=Montipora capricornis TaxID=246305 RepID=UPI0035F13978